MGDLGFASFVPDKEVRLTPELGRVAAIPRRQWKEQDVTLTDLLSPLLSTDTGTMTLWPTQAQALHDAGVIGGLLAPARVGAGKTLISLLCPTVMDLKRPLVIVPANLVEKTKREMRNYAQHWKVPYASIRVVSYSLLGRDSAKDLLKNHRPDGIICVVVHLLKNRKAAVTRRVSRYMDEHPETKFVGMSGTITKRSLKDYAHILKWIFKDAPPIPRGWAELEEWCNALDEKTNPNAMVLHPGAILRVLAGPEDGDPSYDPTGTARRAYRRRLSDTPGIVSTAEGYLGCSLHVSAVPLPGPYAPAVELAMAGVRDDSKTPDGWVLADGMSVWRTIRELALGFYYVWDPRPPETWTIVRQAWAKFVRETIKYLGAHHEWDTELQVANAIRAGHLEDENGIHALWRETEPSFTPNTVPVWLDSSTVEWAAAWLDNHPRGICWVEHRAFGEALAAISGRPYFGTQGKDAKGNLIDHPDTPMGPCIASVSSNATGRNLQRWSDSLIVSFLPNGLQNEQLLGRMHRHGQEEDTVTATVLLGCIEHLEAIERARSDAAYIQDTTGQQQKLLYCDLDIPEQWDIVSIPSRRYQR